MLRAATPPTPIVDCLVLPSILVSGLLVGNADMLDGIMTLSDGMKPAPVAVDVRRVLDVLSLVERVVSEALGSVMSTVVGTPLFKPVEEMTNLVVT